MSDHDDTPGLSVGFCDDAIVLDIRSADGLQRVHLDPAAAAVLHSQLGRALRDHAAHRRLIGAVEAALEPGDGGGDGLS